MMANSAKNNFEQLIKSNPDPENVFSFLEKEVPDFVRIVSEEFKHLRESIKEKSSKLDMI